MCATYGAPWDLDEAMLPEIIPLKKFYSHFYGK
jgi:hypothetical protein